MKYKLLILLFLFLSSLLAAQITNLGSLNPDTQSRYSDIWGYVDENDNEYAIMGGYQGTHFIDVTDPASPQDVGFIAGPPSIWRDMKVHGHYAYITTEGTGNGEGLQIIDLSGLPESVTLVTTIDQYFTSAHNIFIDNGYAFVIGTSGIGGMHILDLADPENPVETAYYTESGYIHDVYVWDDTVVACAEDSYDLVDITDKENPFLISESIELPGIYAHSGWMTEDKRYFIACEEFNQRDITVWDLQDRSSWELVVSEWEMPTQSTVHNLFIQGDYAHISYYTDGYVVLDISNPEEPILVDSYDTDPTTSSGYEGAWGCYPYLPSGNTLISDINRGLFVLKFEPVENISPMFSPLPVLGAVSTTDDVNISTKITDDGEITEALIWYRTVIDEDTSEWVSSSYTSLENKNYVFTVPGQQSHTVVEYYFAAKDDEGVVVTYPEGGSGVNPAGNIPPQELLKYTVFIPGRPVVASFLPAEPEVLYKKGDKIDFSVTAYDTTGISVSYVWFVGGNPRGTDSVLTLNTSIGIADDTTLVELHVTNIFYDTLITWQLIVDNTTGLEEERPLTYDIQQNYPNPFNPSTNIKFSVPEAGNVSIIVYSVTGEEVARPVNSYYQPGSYSVNFNASHLTSGVYLARVVTNGFSKTIKMLLQK